MAIIQHLVVEQYGAFVGKHSERITVTVKDKTVAQAPLLHLESITIASNGVSLSTDAVRECSERGIPIFFLSGRGEPYASLYAAGLSGTVATRRAQLWGYYNGRGLQLAIWMAIGKLQNQINFLRYLGKYRKDNAPEIFNELNLRTLEIGDAQAELERMVKRVRESEQPAAVNEDGTLRAELDEVRLSIMGQEGRAAQRYWGAVKLVAPEGYGFPGRQGREADDPVNVGLNYGYGILYGQVERAVVLAGLDPYAGYLHADRPGKPSFVPDLIEEFRQPVVDRTVIAMANLNVAFEREESGRLTPEFRKNLAGKVIERLEAPTNYRGERHSLRTIIQKQARLAAGFLRGDEEKYEAYAMAW